MKQVLIVTYSQSGETARVATLFADALRQAGNTVTVEMLKPVDSYPYPWRSIRRFFDAMPESVLGIAPPIETPHFDPRQRFDLIIIAYPVWFLSPALPIRAFYAMPEAETLRGTDVVTIAVCRAMWQRASLTTRTLLARAGARQCDNVVVTHRGSPILTLVSTPRTLLFGRKDKLMGVFPDAGVSNADLTRIERLAATLARRLGEARPAGGSLLAGEPAVAVKRWLIVPERLAGYCFTGAAIVIRGLGRLGKVPRAIGVYGFALFLVTLILVGLPLTLLGTLIASPFIAAWLNRNAKDLAEPTGAAKPAIFLEDSAARIP